MPSRFCAICGKIIDESAPHFGMCLKCYLKENPLFEVAEKFTLTICIDCGKYKIREEWIESPERDLFSIIEDAIRKFLLKKYLKSNNIKFSISFDENSFSYTSRDLLTSLNCVIKGNLVDNPLIENQTTIKVILNYELCKNCSNIRGGTYYTSIIQLRVKHEDNFNIIQEVLEKLNVYVNNLFEKDPKQYITKIEDQRYGVDLYLSTNELMNHIIKFLKKDYEFLLKRTKKLIGRDIQKGKNIYRLKSLIKFLPINKNNIILIENHKYKIENISKKKIILRDLEDDKKVIKDYSYFFKENYKII
jgi:nonsense-mediated mRNA decay protein 3